MTISNASNEDLLQLAIETAKRKQKRNARVLFLKVYERDRRNELAMLWLAKIAPSRSESMQWLERVLEVNPDNRKAKQALEQLKYKQAAEENRALLLFGGIAVLMILIVVTVIAVVVFLL